ncbi:nitrogenase component 1 [Fusobacterium sp.]|uniref:nitrogenase component 1 n=1 Tax=Fusobacterium sp. TaxID=68766 RepID=UPI0028FED997|nr:nitrogenase component 1 [Fusobacterium sp.]MDU1909759.1 nitrogenase component 1 [Fusobacterium sp.]
MSLCRTYPTPSNRMSVMWSLMPIKNSVVLEYGPAGTTHFGAGFYGSFDIDLENSLFTTHISEDDIIMGDVSRLEKAIIEVDESYHPEVIFIVASAVIAVIGTDIKGVCTYMQDKVKAKLICFDDGGFGGDYTVGLENTYTLFIKEFALPENTFKNSDKYNILGASAASYRIRSDIWEIKDLMKRSFNMENGVVLGLEAKIEDLKKMGEAAINIVLRKEALPAAKLLKEKFGTPYLYQCPYGYNGTLEWADKISKLLSKKIDASFKKQLEEKIKDIRDMSRMMMATRMRIQPTASIIGDYDTLKGFSDFCKEFAFIIDKKICNHSLKNIDSDDENIISYKKEKDKINSLKDINGQLVFGDEVSLNICNYSNTKVCISFPYPSKTQIATHLPFMGERGTDYLMEIIREYLSNMR